VPKKIPGRVRSKFSDSRCAILAYECSTEGPKSNIDHIHYPHTLIIRLPLVGEKYIPL